MEAGNRPMADSLADDALRTKVLAVLEDNMGPAEALIFLAFISREPFNYQRWRDERFIDLTASETLASAQDKDRT